MSNFLTFSIKKIIDYRIALFILFCGILGGTSQNIYEPKIIIYWASVILLGVTFWKHSFGELWRQDKFLISLFMIAVIYGLLQLVPLPPKVWLGLSTHENASQSFKLMGAETPWLPLALNPAQALKSLLSVLPIFVIYFLTRNIQGLGKIKAAIKAIIILGLFSLILGAIQVIDPVGSFYLYEVVNDGFGVGVFSNINHQATLISICFVFSLYILVDNLLHAGKKNTTLTYGALTLIFFIGLLSNGSSASYIFIPVILMATALFLMKSAILRKPIFVLLPIAFLLIVAALDFLVFDRNLDKLINSAGEDKLYSRRQIWQSSLDIFKENLPFGSGMGSYRQLFSQQELIDNVSNSYVPHAHNEYIEFALEYGLVGAGLIAAFGLWWCRKAVEVFNSLNTSTNYAVPAIISVLVVMIHSGFDYPLRTLSISAIIGFCLALISRNDLKP